jgi:uncharacterized iron-regulated protein
MNLALRMMSLLLMVGLGLPQAKAQGPDVWNGRVYDVWKREFISEREAREQLAQVRILVLGEKHDTAAVQAQQARALGWAVESQQLGPLDRWTLGWEFLNASDQSVIDSAWLDLREGRISGEEALDRLQGAGRSRSYLPILLQGLRFGGGLVGVNLSRAQKAPILTGGLASIDPSLIPPEFEMGGPGYRERFEAVMSAGGHATPEQIERYFEAQCLTDDVLAHELLRSRVSFRALVVGSFHSDYFDGVIARLKARAPDQPVHSIRFVDASEYRKDQLEPELVLREPVRHKRYGELADWVWFAGEPR